MQQFKRNPLNVNEDQIKSEELERFPQRVIEDKMRENIYLGNYEAVFLYSNEGLPLAQVTNKNPVDQAGMVEISLMLEAVQRTVNSVGEFNGLKEILIEGINKRKVVFRFFNIFDQPFILAVIVTPGRSYKNLTNRLVKTVQTTLVE